ncbi:NUDIX hydrolase [Kineococcus xinjiangensis]|uniref:NUDIX hydrolase n=1 Tax=Kineococcus xinjiangensis TaxID=512762 RepID=UPI000CEC4F60|nr:NUDIX domain-containing protein [Kineococcus xinjiangensis]
MPEARGGRPGRVEAAGCVVHRRHQGRLQVLLVHRPARRDRGEDWSWPKGKLDPEELPAVAAVRETAEESGLAVRLGPRLGSLRYPLADGRRKRVRYWAASALGGTGVSPQPPEVDDVAWVDLDEAARRLTHPQDCEPLTALRALLADHPQGTWPLVVLRHGKAHPRSEWTAPDFRRPLAPVGVAQAEVLVDLLACWGPGRVLTSPWVRCSQTVRPFAAAAGLRLEPVDEVTEDAHERSPEEAAGVVARLLEGGEASVLCSHRPVLPTLLRAVAARSEESVAQRLRRTELATGELVVTHVDGAGGAARVVAVERHAT